MQRRSFLKSLAAVGLAPLLPGALSGQAAAAMSASPVATIAGIPSAEFMWAETIARAHRYCNVPMLQRHLNLDLKAAQTVHSKLIANGVIGAQADAYGMHKAVKPLFDGAFPNTPEVSSEMSVQSQQQESRAANDNQIWIHQLYDRADCEAAFRIANIQIA